jgi:RimJ/RimL family protein N-acetyltransferase
MLIGKNVRLRTIERDDLSSFVDWLNDPEVRQFIAWRLPTSLDLEQGWYEGMKKQSMELFPLSIEVFTEAGWILIGDISFMEMDRVNGSSEIGILIGKKDFWGKGYGMEAMRLMLAHGFLNLNLNRIFLRVFDTNPRAIRCYEKAGFLHEGRMRQAVFINGSYVDVLIMGILRQDWRPEE